MGLFDKLKSLVSDDKKDTGTIEIIAPLSGEIVNIEDVPDVVFAEKIVGDGIAMWYFSLLGTEFCESVQCTVC